AMNLGSILIAIAVLAVVVTYLARPFRLDERFISDRTIDAWVAWVRAEAEDEKTDAGGSGGRTDDRMEAGDLTLCPACGQPVRTSDRFCSACGDVLKEAQG
ncbi:MAG: zinc ribbon domain-containing protein, partial [Chloroflexota bacterium]